MAEPKIRKATQEDLKQVWAMYQASGEELCRPAPEEDMQKLITENIGSFYVADLEGVILSQRVVMHDWPITYKDNAGDQKIEGSFMGLAYTLPDCRGRGLSTKIFEAIESDARGSGIKALYVAAEGPGMVEWWVKKGAEELGECKACSRADAGCSGIKLLVKYLT